MSLYNTNTLPSYRLPYHRTNVFQWHVQIEEGDSENKKITIKIQTRNYDPSVDIDDTRMRVTDQITESLIRKYFVEAARIKLSTQVTKYNNERKNVIEAMIKEREQKKAGRLIELVSSANMSGNHADNGLLLLEPFESTDSAIAIDGTMFPSHASRASKRLRLTVDTTSGPAPVQYASTASDKLCDYRILGGTFQVMSTNIYGLLSELSNIYGKSIEIGSSPTHKCELPTILDYNDLSVICGHIGTKNYNLLPLHYGYAVEEINKRIYERKSVVTAVYTNRLIINIIDRIMGTFENGFMEGDVATLKTAVRSLMDDPILFIKGPRRPFEEDTNKTYFMNLNNDILENTPGFTLEHLHYFGPETPTNPFMKIGVDAARNSEEERYSFIDVVNEPSPKIQQSVINTLWNLLLNPHADMVVRLSDWEQTQEVFETLTEVPIIDNDPTHAIPSLEPAWHATSSRNRDREFRLSLMESKNDTGDIAKDIDYDTACSVFEIDMHAGDMKSHKQEIMNVLALTIQMLLAERQEHIETIELSKLSDDPYNTAFPSVVDNINVTSHHNAYPPAFTDGSSDKITSACSDFLIKSAVLTIAHPLTGKLLSYDDIIAILSASDPFPLSEELYALCKPVYTMLEKKIDTVLQNGIYLTQYLENRVDVETQPTPPLFIKFSNHTTDKLDYTIGSEATPVLESIILANRVVTSFSTQKGEITGDARDAPPGEFYNMDDYYCGDTPVVVNTHMPYATCFERDHHKEFTRDIQLSKTKKIVDTKAYAKSIGMSAPYHYLQHGRSFIYSEPTLSPGKGTVGLFDVSTKPISQMYINYNELVNFSAGESIEKIYTDMGRLENDKIIDKQRFEIPVEGNIFQKKIIQDNKSYIELIENYDADFDTDRVPVFVIIGRKKEMVGWAIFKNLSIIENKIDTSKTILSRLLIYDSRCIFPMHVRNGRQYYYSKHPLIIGKTNKVFILKQQFPLMYTDLKSAEIYKQQLKHPHKHKLHPYIYKQKAVVTDAENLTTKLVEGINGLHYTNTRALSRTVFALVLNDHYTKLYDYLDMDDRRYGGKKIKWAYDVYGKHPIGSVILNLHSAHLHSVTKMQDSNFVEHVIVSVQGPGINDIATNCIVNNWFYKTQLYLSMEVIFFAGLYGTLSAIGNTPPDAHARCLAYMMKARIINDIETLVTMKPNAVSNVVSLLIDFYEQDKISHATQKARNPHALDNLTDSMRSKLITLLFYT